MVTITTKYDYDSLAWSLGLDPQQIVGARHPGEECLGEPPVTAGVPEVDGVCRVVPGVHDDGVHGGEVLRCGGGVAGAGLGALLGVRVAQATLAALELVQAAARGRRATVGAGADVGRAVGWVVEAVLLAPDIHGTTKRLPGRRGNADLTPDHQSPLAALGRGVPDHDSSGVVRGGQEHGGTHDPHVCAVSEGFLGSAAQPRRTVGALAPGVSGGPGPLEDTPGADQAPGQHRAPPHHHLLASLLDGELLLPIELSQRVLVKTGLGRLVPSSHHRADLEGKSSMVVGGQLDLDVDDGVLDVGSRDDLVSIVAPRLVMLWLWLVEGISTNSTPE